MKVRYPGYQKALSGLQARISLDTVERQNTLRAVENASKRDLKN